MKFKNKAIISAVTSAALMLAGAVGGTIAFFTTSSETNVNVTSGKIGVTTVVSDLKTYSLEQEQNPAGSFENGGTASLNATTQVVTLDRMTPGDKATFKIAVSIDNNVKVKYRVVFNKTGELSDALVANVSGGASEWMMINPSENPTAINLDASVEMPLTAGIEYSDKNGAVKIMVEAVQGNMPDAVSTAAELEAAIAAIPSTGGEVNLYIEDDITLTQIMEIPNNSQVNLYGDGDTTINNAAGASRVINLDEVSNSTLTLSGVTIHQGPYVHNGPANTNPYARCISAYGTTDCTINIYDSSLKNDTHYPINVAGGNTNLTINIEDSNIEGYCAVNVWSSGTIINIKDSTLKGVNKSSGDSDSFATIVVNEGASNVQINLDNSVVESIELGNAYEAFYSIREIGTVITSTNTSYKYTRAGSSVAETYASVEDILNYNTMVRLWMVSSNAYYTYQGIEYLAYDEVQLNGDTTALSYPFFDVSKFDNAASITNPTNCYLGERTVLLANQYAQTNESSTLYSIANVLVNGQKFAICDYLYN